MEKFTEAEVATIRKFFAWIEEGGWIDAGDYGSDGIIGLSDEGVMCREFNAVEDYGSYTLERSDTFISLLALTDPPAFDAQMKAERRREAAEEAARRRQQIAEQESHERAILAQLQQKYA